MRRLRIAAAAALLGLATVLAPVLAEAQEDYTARGLSVYAPRPVRAQRGGGPAAAAPAPVAQPAPTTAQAVAVRQKAQAMLEERLPRRLTVRNTNTGEEVSVVYWVAGEYDSWELARIAQLLRDHHQHETVAIDWRLADLLWVLGRLTGGNTVHVHSGYRSEATNTYLASTNSGVASDSQHRHGKALDISFPGVSSRSIAGLAAALAWGGTGYYGDEGHVHVDVGPTRTWGF
ncbi:MAG: DUF882 domain-containing protein [Reyranellaceae bacterium]